MYKVFHSAKKKRRGNYGMFEFSAQCNSNIRTISSNHNTIHTISLKKYKVSWWINHWYFYFTIKPVGGGGGIATLRWQWPVKTVRPILEIISGRHVCFFLKKRLLSQIVIGYFQQKLLKRTIFLFLCNNVLHINVSSFTRSTIPATPQP